MKIGISGAGKMAHEVKELILERKDSGIIFCGMYEPLSGTAAEEAFTEIPDVVIDFSNPANTECITDYAVKHRAALIVATTGLGSIEEGLVRTAAQSIPVVYSANFSLGITVLLKAVKDITAGLDGEFDIEIVEKHHRRKADAPSGTALLLADAVNSEGKYEFTYGRCGSSVRRKEEIGVHAVRGGGITGEHTVIFAGDDEVIELTHRAGSRRIFASGALKAAEYAAGKQNGLYDMADVLGIL